jgi:hypothetical protein
MIAAITPGTVQIRYHREERQGLTAVAYQKLYDVKAHDQTANLDVLWKASRITKDHQDHIGLA